MPSGARPAVVGLGSRLRHSLSSNSGARLRRTPGAGRQSEHAVLARIGRLTILIKSRRARDPRRPASSVRWRLGARPRGMACWIQRTCTPCSGELEDRKLCAIYYPLADRISGW